MTFGICVTHSSIFTSVVHELRREDIADAQGHAILENFLVDDRETIARLDVEHEIDVVLKNLGEIESDAVGKISVGSSESGSLLLLMMTTGASAFALLRKP